MFNLQGSEIIVILLLALVVLGPEKLPDAIRRFTQTYNELKKMGSGFQSELKSALDEPIREMRETAEMVRDAADPDKIASSTERGSPKPGDPPFVDPAEPEPEPAPRVNRIAAANSSAAIAAAGARDPDDGATADPASESGDAGDGATADPVSESGDAGDGATADPATESGETGDGATAGPASGDGAMSGPAGPSFHSAAPHRSAPPPVDAAPPEPDAAPPPVDAAPTEADPERPVESSDETATA